MAYGTGRCMCHAHQRIPFEADDVVAMVRKVFDGRVVFHDGDEQLAPGLTLHHIGGHSMGLQCVRVKTRRGHVVLAADATHLYAHVNEGRVFPITYSVAENAGRIRDDEEAGRLAGSHHSGPRPGRPEALSGGESRSRELDHRFRVVAMRMKLLIVALLLAAGPLLAQTKPVATKPAPRLPNGQPDFAGLWQGGGPISDISQGLPKGETMPLLPAARRSWSAHCPRTIRKPTACRPACRASRPIRGASCRRRRTSSFSSKATSTATGRSSWTAGKHPADPDPTWYGHSIGRWEGDTLVVDTVGFNDKFWFDFNGHPHTERAAHDRALYAEGLSARW